MAVQTKRSFCRICHAACPVDVHIDNSSGRERVIKVTGSTRIRSSTATPASRVASFPTRFTIPLGSVPRCGVAPMARSKK